MKLLLLGATGLVGSAALRLALAHPAITEVIAPTRQPLPPAAKLTNPAWPAPDAIVPLLQLHRPDAILCALGSTMAKAGSKEAFHHVDHELPLAFGQAAHAAGVKTYGIVSAMGAATNSMSFYYRTKGELERDLQNIGFGSLTIARPGLIGGKRGETRVAERTALALLQFLAPLLPRKFRANPADVIAAKLLEAVLEAKAGCRWIDSQEMI